uniref:30S ribosomal protein S6 n=1 Tax=Anthurium amnicola TaxID=1678845 RepID=A0A1D1Z437_9ARAE
MEPVLRSLSPPSSSPATPSGPSPPGLLFQPVPRREWALQRVPKKGAAACCCLFSDGLSSQRQWSRRQQQRQGRLTLGGRGAGRVVAVGAKKKKKKNSGNSDTDGFAALPDENEFFFPEAVLLKKRTVQEDGRVLPEFADAEEEKLFEYLNLQLESDLKLERMRHYEVVYLIHEDYLQEVDNVVSKVQDFIRERRGRIWRLNNWGLRRLAYKIKKAKNANYILMNIELEAKYINDFKSMLDKDERIIRHLVIKRDKGITEDCPPPPEFHPLRSGGIDDDDDDEEYDNGEHDSDDVVESEMGDHIDDNFGDNIIVVDNAEEDNFDVSDKNAKILKARNRVNVTS